VTLGRCHANLDGFDLHAGTVVPAGQRARLERLCCYTLRPPIAQTRLRVDAEGQVWIALRRQWSDGTTHLRFDPVAFLERLAVLIPRPRINLVLYYGASWNASSDMWACPPTGRSRGPLVPRRSTSMISPVN
jgi:hypothetical protein